MDRRFEQPFTSYNKTKSDQHKYPIRVNDLNFSNEFMTNNMEPTNEFVYNEDGLHGLMWIKQ